jgi:hypothetical protein
VNQAIIDDDGGDLCAKKYHGYGKQISIRSGQVMRNTPALLTSSHYWKRKKGRAQF